MANKSLKSILIWDHGSIPPDIASITLLWRSYEISESSSCVSLPRFIEANAISIRALYLAWIYDLGEYRIFGKRIVDWLELRPGFSYWWTTLLVEKNNFRDVEKVTESVKLLAFDLWSDAISGHRKIILHTHNKSLTKCISAWCRRKGWTFEANLLELDSPKFSWRGFVNK